MATSHCAIEMEPKTLNPGQLNQAKELAAGIIQKTEPQETSEFLIEEVMQSEMLAGMEQIITEENNGNGLNIPYQCIKDIDKTSMESTHHCLCNSLVVESPIDEARQREPLTAPF